MNILLDSSAIISYLRGNEELRNIIESADEVLTSSLCAYEVLEGENYSRIKRNRTGNEVATFLEDTTIVPLDRKDAEIAAEAQARLMVKGLEQNAIDVLIGASAVRNEVELITRDGDYGVMQEVLGLKFRKV